MTEPVLFTFLIITGAVLAGVVLVRWGRIRRDESSFEPSSLGIVMRKYGWAFGLLKIWRSRAALKRELRTQRDIARAKIGPEPPWLADAARQQHEDQEQRH